MTFFNTFPSSKFVLVGTDGQVKSHSSGHFTGKGITTTDLKLTIEPGDEIRRQIPENREEVFEVLECDYHEFFHGIDAHFTVKTRRKGLLPAGTGGNYINVNGHNARIVIGSVYNSSNSYQNRAPVFQAVRGALQAIPDEALRSIATQTISEMQTAKSDRDMIGGYQKLIALLVITLRSSPRFCLLLHRCFSRRVDPVAKKPSPAKPGSAGANTSRRATAKPTKKKTTTATLAKDKSPSGKKPTNPSKKN